MWDVVLFTLILTYVIYYCCFKPYNYWKNRGIPYEIPLPVVGNFGQTLFKRKHPSEVYDYLYKKYSNERYVGIYIFMKPALLIRDRDLIKKICEDEFDHFQDRVKIFDKNLDAVIGNNLVSLKGKEWKDNRTILNSVFSDSHIKSIFNEISHCAKAFTSYFVNKDEDFLEIKLNDFISRYDCDVISRICFGVTSNSLEDRSNEFYTAYRILKGFGGFQRLKLSFIQLCPILSKILRITVFPSSKTELYKKMAKEALRHDDKGREIFFKYMTEAAKGVLKNEKGDVRVERSVRFDESGNVSSSEEQGKEWSEDQLTAHALMFLQSHSGIEAVLSATSFLAYELALSPSVQVKLQEEIDNVQNSCDNNVTYEAISQMKYLECVVAESLRKWPPLYQTDRETINNFVEVEPSVPDDEKIVIEKNTAIIIPIMAIHRDPKFFPQPHKFSPERFSDENKSNIIQGSYMPFGMGPRSCIGSKLALLEIKLLFYHLLSKFDLVPTANTKIRVEVDSSEFDGAVNTFLGLKPRKVTSL